jgi:hypothetical protein
MGSCSFSHERFKDPRILQNFIEENLDSVYQHYRNGIETPFNLHVVNQGHLEEKMRRHNKLSGDIHKIQQELGTLGSNQKQQSMIESARVQNQSSLNILHALIGDFHPKDPEKDKPEDDAKASSDNKPIEKVESEKSNSVSSNESQDNFSDCFDDF